MLRSARVEDSSAVATVLIESRRRFLPFAPSAHSEDEVRRWVHDSLVPAGRVVVAEREGQVVAVLSTSAADGMSWIDQLYVLPGHTGQGIGSALLEHAHHLLQRPIRLYTFQQNILARRFYERHGYNTIALTDGKDNEEQCPDVLLEITTPAEA